jgi:hypothetical protein
VAKETVDSAEMKSKFADRINAALESARRTVSDLNEALAAKKKPPAPRTPTEAGPAPSCPDEGKSA